MRFGSAGTDGHNSGEDKRNKTLHVVDVVELKANLSLVSRSMRGLDGGLDGSG